MIQQQNQFSSPQEYVIIADEFNRQIGTILRDEMRRQRLIHRASYILVFNSAGEIFVIKRTMTKDIYPGYYEIAAGGVVVAGESYDDSATRELSEELGVTKVNLTPWFDHFYEDSENRVWGRIYTCVYNGPMVLQQEEVESGRFMTVADILELNKIELFTPDCIEILIRLQEEKPEVFDCG